ncbi:hypothetical protein HDU99_002751, partial [Rhizoclosmatium hyalinum]
MKVLAFAITQQRNLRVAENSEKVSAFFSKVATVPSDCMNSAEYLEAEKGWPKYMTSLKHAETILAAIDNNVVQKHNLFHPEQFLSVMEAQLQIRELKLLLAQKDQQISHLNDQFETMSSQIADSHNQEVAKLKLALNQSYEELAATKRGLLDANKRIASLESLPDKTDPSKRIPSQLEATKPSFVSGIISHLRRSSAFSGVSEPIPSRQKCVDASTKIDNEAILLAVPQNIALPQTESSVSVSDSESNLEHNEQAKRSGFPDDPSASLKACGEWFQSAETYDFFISYRVASDARVAMELYFRLSNQRVVDEYGYSRQVKVYWDKECLKKGQDWRDSFVQGLKNSR